MARGDGCSISRPGYGSYSLLVFAQGTSDFAVQLSRIKDAANLLKKTLLYISTD